MSGGGRIRPATARIPCPAAAPLAALLLLAAGPGAAAGRPAAPPPAAAPGVAVTVSPPAPRPGDVVLLRVEGGGLDLRAEWDGRAVPLFATGGGRAGLVGIDLDVPPRGIVWRVLGAEAGVGAVPLARGTVAVPARSFPTQRLTLPAPLVDLDAAALARVEAERAELRAALAASAGERLWRGPFRAPVEGGRATGGFGLRRLINGQPRSPHTGYDWAAPAGTPVMAANAGRAVLVAEHFFAGRNVVLDHGLGLFTLYYHLDAARVTAGERVAAGQVVGTVGATGRVTGAHLHFAVLLAGARVDPESLLGLALPPEP